MRYLTLLVVFCFNQALGQYTTLSFEVKDSLKRPIVFFEPIEGHANTWIPTYSIKNNSSNEFTFKRRIRITEPVAIQIRFGYAPFWLYIEPGQNILIDINLNLYTGKSTNGGLKITGPNARGNEYFNDFNFQPGRKFKLTDDILLSCDAKNPLKTIKYYEQKVDSSFVYLKRLKSKKLITPTFYKLVTNDLDLSYLREFGIGLLQSKTDYKSKCEIIDSLYRVYNPENEKNLQGFFNGPYCYSYGIYKNTSSFNSGSLPEDTTIRIGTSNYKIAKNFVPFIYLKGDVMKFEWGMSLYLYKAFYPDRFKETDLAPYFNEFPDSWLRHTINFEKKNYTNPSDHNSYVDSSKIFVLNAGSLNSFNEVFNVFFKNKLVYVDFWATWCLPCKEEFSFNSSLDSFFLKNDIERLYVSFDYPGNREAVLKNIYSFKLYGKHLLLNKKLFEDIIDKIYGGSTRYSIPRYLIINKKSQIVENNAKRPSSGEALMDQLKIYLEH